MTFIDTIYTLTLTEKRDLIKTLKVLIRTEMANNRQAKIDAKVQKQVDIASKREVAILKAQARLQKLLDKQSAPVGSKAIKANKKPSKVITYGAEDNAIAASIITKKMTAAALKQTA